MEADDEGAIRGAAIRLLARREHSRQELGGKLEQRGFTPERVSGVLQQLVDEGLLSDPRFAEAYVRMRSQRGFGPLRIRAELRERGLSAPLIDTALQAEPTDWFELAARVRCKRFGETLPVDYKERARQMRFLQYRGFEQEQLNAALNN